MERRGGEVSLLTRFLRPLSRVCGVRTAGVGLSGGDDFCLFTAGATMKGAPLDFGCLFELSGAFKWVFIVRPLVTFLTCVCCFNVLRFSLSLTLGGIKQAGISAIDR